MSSKLLCERPGDGIALLTFNRPDVLNAFDIEMAALFSDALLALARDEAVRCIVMTGAGGRAFSSGNDIQEMARFGPDDMVAAFVARDPLTWQVANHPKPVIAALNGVTYGAGALIAAAADIRIGSRSMTFKVTASAYGGANATWTLPRIVGMAKAKEILLAGRAVGAEEALAIGLLNQLVDDGTCVEAAVALATAIAANPAAGVQGIKQLINDGVGRSYADAFRAEFAWMLESTRKVSASGAEIFSGFLSRRSNKEHPPD